MGLMESPNDETLAELIGAGDRATIEPTYGVANVCGHLAG